MHVYKYMCICVFECVYVSVCVHVVCVYMCVCMWYVCMYACVCVHVVCVCVCLWYVCVWVDDGSFISSQLCSVFILQEHVLVCTISSSHEEQLRKLPLWGCQT